MKLNKFIIIYILITLFIIILIYRFFPFKGKMNTVLSDYISSPGTTHSFYIPLFSYDYDDTNNKITMKNSRSYFILKEEIKKEFSTYRKINCDGKEYYYNDITSKDSYTIIEYGIKNHFIYNNIYYKYSLGNYCETKY